MAVTELEDVVSAIAESWPSLFSDELRATHPIVNLLDRSYDAEFSTAAGIDRAHINQYDAGAGQDLIVDRVAATDTACDFTPTKQLLSTVDLIINRRAVSSREFCDTVELLSKVKPTDDKLRQTMAFEVSKVINDRIYAIVSASAAAPDHVLESTATFDAGVLTTLTQLADEANWPMDSRYVLIDPKYNKDLLDDTTLVSADFVGDRPTIGGRIMTERFGWKIVMDNSAGLKSLNTVPGTAGNALAFIPEFMHWASPRSQVKVSDTHSSLKFGMVMSMDTVYGVAQGIDGDNKVIQVKTGA